ncbi:DNA cytosine methyltransferase [Luteimonas qiangzhengi]|uniref:DNA cytosine methyltransferase n=1 Tax=Luteimonas sp. MJ146 TaxID=3129240 RepID=UPI0031B9F9EB
MSNEVKSQTSRSKEEISAIDQRRFTCVDLFAGCGGLSLGLAYAGWEGLFAIERDPMAFETFSNNFLQPEAPYRGFERWPAWLPKKNQDLVTLLQDDLERKNLASMQGKVSLVAGGPPCQGFSVGGSRDGADERNNLVFQMLDLISLVRPEAVLIENVEGIMRKFVARPGAESASAAEGVMNELEKLGYTSVLKVLDATLFGVPQTRRRVVIIGLRETDLNQVSLRKQLGELITEAGLRVRGQWGLPLTSNTSARQAIDDLAGGQIVQCPDSPKFSSSFYGRAASAYARAMRRGARAGTVPDSHRYSKHGERISKLYELAHRTQPPGRLKKSFLLENNTKKDKKVLIDPTCPVSTITTHPDEFIHYKEPRNITVREMARFQSFPDDFHFFGRYTINGPRRKYDVARCSQVGNAVPPLMAQGVGLALLELLKSA